MLKDLEQRGAGSTDAIKISSTALSASMPQPNSFPYIKVGLLLTLLAGGVYSWLQTKPTSSLNINITDAISRVTANKPTATLVTEKPAPKSATTTSQTTAAPSSTEQALKPTSSAMAPTTSAAPLFETELRYTPSFNQTPPAKLQKEKAAASPSAGTVTAKPATIKPVNPAVINPTIINQAEEPANSNNDAGKPPVIKHSLPKLSSKPSNDKLGNDNLSTGKEIRPDQKSGNYYRLALTNLQQGRVSETLANLTQSLEANPANQEARQTLAGLLLDNKRNDEAKAILSTGLTISPEQSDFRIALARLQVESGDRATALTTLEQGLAYAKSNADYQSFLATLLQRADRHEEAISHYMSAVSLGAATPSTLIGLGISLQAVGKLENAKESFTRAQTNTSLTPALALFVEQRLKQINQRLHN